jgi:hypothetical protein
MPQFLAVVAYRCLVAGVPSGSIDLQVKWFDVADDSIVRQLIEADPVHAYKNSDDETVSWELAEVFSVEPFSPTRSGEEVAGFIANTSELVDLA